MSGSRLMAAPRSVGIAITGKCNLRCKYCFYSGEMAALSDLRAGQWLAFFDELGRLGVMDVTLTGGEPFTRLDLFELIDGLTANRMRYSILSNGTLIDDRLLARLYTNKRLQRLNYVQISIDGSCREIHDKSRPESFDRALRGLGLLKEAGIPVVVRTTINRHNLYDLENIARLLLDEVGLASFGTNDAMPIGAGCANEAEVMLTAREQAVAMETMGRLLARYPGRLLAQAGPQANRAIYADMARARQAGGPGPRSGMGYLTACGCVFSRLDIQHDGTIVPCHLLPGLFLGNITADSLADIWRAHPVLRALRERRSIPMREVPGCEDCEWTSWCNGGCPGLAHQLTGELNRANPHDCYRLYLMGQDKNHDF